MRRLTVSVSVSFNKVFAKLGSDLKNRMQLLYHEINAGTLSGRSRQVVDLCRAASQTLARMGSSQ